VIALPPLRPIARVLSSFLVALLAAGPVQPQTSDPPAAAPPAAEILPLTPGASLEREIRGGETQSFEIQMEAGVFVFLEISQQCANLATNLLNPAGESVATAERSDGPGSQLLAWIAKDAGPHKLVVMARIPPALSGRFRLTVRELRPAIKGDESRVRAASALAEGRRLQGEQNKEAILFLENSLTLWKAASDSRGEVESLLDLGILETSRGDPGAALGWYEKALARSQEIEFSEGEAWSLAGMGFCKSRLALYDEALALYMRSLEVWKRLGSAYHRAYALEALGNAYLEKRDPEAALRTFQEALPLALESGDLVRKARITNGLGSSQLHGGRPSEASATLEKALALSRSISDREAEGAIEHNLAASYQRRGQLQKAVDMYKRLTLSGPFEEEGKRFYNLGSLYLELGEPEKALENYELSKKAYQQAGQRIGEVDALIGIGSARQRMGEPQAALAFFEQARRTSPEESWRVLHYLGVAQYLSDQPENALSSLQRALDLSQSSSTPVSEAPTRLALGAVYRTLGNLALAEKHLEHAIALGRETESPSILAPALLRRAMVQSDQGRLAEARSDAEQALEIVESTRRNIAGQQIRTSFFAQRRNFYEYYIDLLMRLNQLHPDGEYQALAVEASERARARGLLDLLAEGRINVSDGLSPDLRQREDLLADELSRVQSELRNGTSPPERIRELRAAMDRLDEQREQLDWDIRARNKRYAQVRYPAPLKLRGIQSLVPDERTALLEFVLGERRSFLFAIARSEIRAFELPAADEIARLVRRLRMAIEKVSFASRRDYAESALQLYQVLLAPASEFLADKPNLLIVPDGALFYIPFEALLTEPADDRNYRDLPFLLHRYSITYIPSASVLAGLREPREEPLPAGRKEVAVFAPFAAPGSLLTKRRTTETPRDPTMKSWSFEPLPGSGREASGIAGLYPGAAMSFSGAEADEETVTRNPAVATSRLLHFATHARIDERHPEYSALVFAPRGDADGLLQVHEIFNLRLSADLAVLSACQTALGKEVTGEGLVGLTRAFFYAGVPSLVVSLWNVTDGPTPELMLDFYKDLERLKDKAKALQAAKVAMIARGSYAHPSYWAPFILIGEPR
jgi:CHAT domain-containing protein/Tfp pilus assembly protein PilF